MCVCVCVCRQSIVFNDDWFGCISVMKKREKKGILVLADLTV